MATRIYSETYSRLSPKKAVNAKWYDKVTCNPNSTALLIESDIITSMYMFLKESEDGFSELLKALSATKRSNLKFDRICTDESICTNSANMKMSISFLEDKKEIAVTVKIYFLDNTYCLKNNTVKKVPIRFRHLRKIIKNLEEEYEKL